MEDNLTNKIFNNIASKTVLALIGLFAAVITIYAFLQEKSVDVRYEIIANTNVLDFNADISKLEVSYDSTNLKQSNENLRIITIKIINNGKQHLFKEYLDNNDPLGLVISSGKIIEKPDLIQTSNDYLKRNIKLHNFTKNKLTFSQVILESGEFFVLKLLILHQKDEIPKINSFGKIAGQKNIEVVNSVDIKTEKTFLLNVYEGNIWTQLLRLLSYFLIGVLIILIIVGISEKIDTIREKKRKIKMVREFKKIKSYNYTRMDDAIFDKYKLQGSYSLKHSQILLKNEKDLNENYSELSRELKSKEFRRHRRIDNTNLRFFYEDDWHLINDMISDGILYKENDKLSVNQPMKDTINKFIDFLKEKGEFKKSRDYGSHRMIDENEYEEASDEQ
jgi:hypothetical protein